MEKNQLLSFVVLMAEINFYLLSSYNGILWIDKKIFQINIHRLNYSFKLNPKKVKPANLRFHSLPSLPDNYSSPRIPP